MTSAMLAIVAISFAHWGQATPDIAYSRDDGPVNMCGLTAPDIEGMRHAVRDSGFREGASTAEFVQFLDEEAVRDVVFSNPGYFAHPLVTCREFIERDGALFLNRQMRCDADRMSCDAALQEFNDLDAQMIAEMRGQ